MPRKPHNYHFIYKTVNLVNSKFYIGMHSTSNLGDGYIGSGKRLWYSIKKYGKENFKMEILEFLPNRSSLKEREKEIVNSDLIKEELCMNLQIGGGGGFSSEEHMKKAQCNGGKHSRSIEERERFIELSKKLHKQGKFKYDNFTGKTHTDEYKKMIGEHNSKCQTGTQNSQFGKCWIFHEELGNKSIKKEELDNYLLLDWKKGRKMK